MAAQLYNKLEEDELACEKIRELLEREKQIMLRKINRIYRAVAKSEECAIRDQVMQIIQSAIKPKK